MRCIRADRPSIAGFFCVMMVSIAPAPAVADCTSACDSDYYACTNTSSVGTCSHYRSMCYQRCTLKGPPLRYGAIAYSVSKNRYGYSANFPTQEQAEQRSIEECIKDGGGDDCKPVWFKTPNCGALARGPDRWGSDYAESRDAAEEKALNNCSDGGRFDCTVDIAVCSNDKIE